MRESSLTHQAVRHNAPSDARLLAIRLEFGSSSLGVFFAQFGRRFGPTKFARECLVSKGLNLFQFFLSLLKLILRLKVQMKFDPFQVILRSIKGGSGAGQG